MTLSDLNIPISYNDAQKYALVFTPEVASNLSELHRLHGSPNCVPMPRVLIDGRLMLCGDILTEIEQGGMLHNMWMAADKEILGREVQVIPWEEALSLLPPDPPLF